MTDDETKQMQEYSEQLNEIINNEPDVQTRVKKYNDLLIKWIPLQIKSLNEKREKIPQHHLDCFKKVDSAINSFQQLLELCKKAERL